MMHAYDWGNFKYDQTGSLRQWYSNESAAEYRRRLDCFEKQYDEFRDENVDLNVRECFERKFTTNFLKI